MSCSACAGPLGKDHIRDLCWICARGLPNVTLALYKAGRTSTRCVVDALRMRRTSLKTLRGGRHTRG